MSTEFLKNYKRLSLSKNRTFLNLFSINHSLNIAGEYVTAGNIDEIIK